MSPFPEVPISKPVYRVRRCRECKEWFCSRTGFFEVYSCPACRETTADAMIALLLDGKLSPPLTDNLY